MEIAKQIQVCKEYGLKPGDKINRLAPGCRYVAVIGEVCDWTVYVGPHNWNWKSVADAGDKITAELAAIIFPDIAGLGLYYRL